MLQQSSQINPSGVARRTTIGDYKAGQNTVCILIVEDNNNLRATFTRHLFLEASHQGINCAIFRLNETTTPQLAFFEPARCLATEEADLQLGFLVYEASSPQIALRWLRTKPVSDLTIISDVKMPSTDSDLDLTDFIVELSELALPVNLLIASSESQNLEGVKQLLANNYPFIFITKGSQNWLQLPSLLVRQHNLFSFTPVQLNNNLLRTLNRSRIVNSNSGSNLVKATSGLPVREKPLDRSLSRNKSTKPEKSAAKNFWSKLLGFFHFLI